MSDLRPSLTPRDYVDAAAFDREAEQVLAASWLPVCRADQLAEPGDRVALTLLGRPVVAVRDTGGRIRVLGNVCPHRGSTIVDEGPGHDATLVCPYHRWAFRLDGSFVGAPFADGADLDGVCLTAVRHAEWAGFVLVNLSGDAADPAIELDGLAAAIAPWRWDELVVVGTETFESTWNWKVMVENWIECYHHVGTHRDLLEPVFPARATQVVDNHGAPWTAMTVEGIEGIEGEPEGWIPGLTPDRATQLSVWAAFPALLAGSGAHYGFWLQVVPDSATHHSVRMHLLLHRDHAADASDDDSAGLLDVLRAVHLEDMETCAAVQAGLASGFVRRFRLVELERPIAEFQRWVSARPG